MQALDKLGSKLKRVRSLQEVLSLLNWDQLTYLPKKGDTGRGEQIEVLSELLHAASVDPSLGDAIADAAAQTSLTPEEVAIVREAQKSFARAVRVPVDLAKAIARAESDGYSVWVAARDENNFSVVAPTLSNLIQLKRNYAECIAPQRSHYDALLDVFEPGATGSEVRASFLQIEPVLQSLVARIEEQQNTSTPIKVYGNLQSDTGLSDTGIKELFREVLETMGFDLEAGRFDKTVHPFCADPGHQDIRLTYRVNYDDIAETLFPLMHEAGHGLYDQGYAAQFYGTPLAEACSLAMHESQSLIWEKQIGRSESFLTYLLPRLQEYFPKTFVGWSPAELYRKINQVQRSLIRVEADEVTYGLHVIVRFQLEQSLVSGDLTVADLPMAWNDAYRKTVGIDVPDDLHGVLQDVHWYTGGIGYFPTYLMGAAYAAQLFRAFLLQRPQFPGELASGSMKPLREWLRQTIHSNGKMYSADELIRRATGELPTPIPYTEYLVKKYAAIYGF